MDNSNKKQLHGNCGFCRYTTLHPVVKKIKLEEEIKIEEKIEVEEIKEIKIEEEKFIKKE